MRKQNGKENRYVLDSSAFMTLFEKEDGIITVRDILERALKKEIAVFCSFVSYTEIFYITCQEEGKEEAKKRIGMMDRPYIVRIDSSKELCLSAGELKALYKVSFADAWIAATAIMLDAILVHKDPEFDVLENDIKMLKLPYK